MHYVYLLESAKVKKLYIGCTNNIKKRVIEHNNGDSEYTKSYIPWKLVYFEGCLSKKDAYRRERALKLHAQGLRRLKERLQDSLLRKLCVG